MRLRETRFVSPFILRIFTGRCVVRLCGGCLFVCFVLVLPVKKFCIQLAFHLFLVFPVVDRLCLVLARQCRKKTIILFHFFFAGGCLD